MHEALREQHGGAGHRGGGVRDVDVHVGAGVDLSGVGVSIH